MWALTAQGAALALVLAEKLGSCDVFVSERDDIFDERLKSLNKETPVHRFQSLKQAVSEQFERYSRHVFFMATGIVVRVIAEHVVHKTKDPAVVVVDDKGTFAVSLLSGHIGGANDLAVRVAGVLGATPVITTATDVNGLPSVDVMAVQKGLAIENPEAIKTVNMAFISQKPVGLYDPYGFFNEFKVFERVGRADADVLIDDQNHTAKPGTLVLRPKILVAGIGCNRGTEKEEIRHLLFETLEDHGLSPLSLAALASIDAKQDETGILELAEELNLTVLFFGKDELKIIETIETPSEMVEKHMGVKSVCEAAAILASNKGNLIVPKRKSVNATVALARMNFTL